MVVGASAGGRRAGRVRRLAALSVALVVCSSSVALATTASASAVTAGHRGPRSDPSAFDWPEFHLGPQLNGYASNSPLSTTNASQLGVAWTTNLYGAALDSPVVAYNATLGKTVAYIGTETGYFYAVDVANGSTIWSDWLGAPIRGTPAVSSNTVFVVTALTPRIYALNAATGKTICSLLSVNSIESSPVVATPPGGVRTVYIGVEDGTVSGPLIAMNAATCAIEWQFTGYLHKAGEWDPISYAVDAGGRPLVLFGTADPDSAVYAIDAVTGAEVWEFQPNNPPPNVYDVGTGLVVSPPGANGFADGVAYFTTRFGQMYALDLTTGTEIWNYTFQIEPGSGETGISTTALDGTDLVFGFTGGIDDLNALTGTLKWTYQTPAGFNVDSSPAIAGAPGSEVVAFADLGGVVRVVSLATGTELYSYRTGSYVTASPAISDGNLLIASADGFLYDFGLGGGNESPLPGTTVTSPANGATVPNPGGPLTISGTATDATGVARVDVAVQSGGSAGPWWDAATNEWVPAPVANPADLASPGTTSTPWSFTLPVPPAGGTFQVVVNAVSATGQSDVKTSRSQFTVSYATTGPHLVLGASYAAPGATITLKGGGFAKGEHVAITLPGVTLGTVTASATNGSFANVKLKVPSTTPFGIVSIVAAGQTSGRSASLPLYITNSWTQFGHDAGRVGYEPNDTVLRNLVHPGADIFLGTAWTVSEGTPVTSPVVLDRVVYAGDQAGQVFAVDSQNGAVLWTWHDTSGAAINGSPAVDPASGLLFAGTDDGTLYALSISNGALVWSANLGGDVNPPAYGGGTVFASSSSGEVAALTELTGAKRWSATLASGAGAPALDSSSQRLVVGDMTGDVVAFSSTTGTEQWSHSVGGSGVTTPLLSGKNVYVGGTGQVDALSEASGSLVWSTPLPGGDTASATAQNGSTLVVGTRGGGLYFLSTATGSETQTANHYSSAVVGVAATETVDVADLAGGSIQVFRSWGNRDFLWSGSTNAGLTASPVIVNGTIFVGAGDGGLYAFTPAGDPPL